MAWADDVLDLPGLCPAAASVASLAMERDVDRVLRHDPAAALFLAQHDISLGSRPPLDDSLLLSLLDLVQTDRMPFVDWRRSGAHRVWQVSQAIAALAEAIANKVGAEGAKAFTAGLLAPLGWLGLCAVQPGRIFEMSAVEHAALARRLVRSWRLPAWLADIVGHLDWNVDLVARLGANPQMVAIVQLAVATIEKAGDGLNLVVGTPPADLLTRLQLTEESLAEIVTERKAIPIVPAFEDPRSQPLLADIVRLKLENRQRRETQWIAQLNGDIDRLQAAFSQQIADEDRRLAKQKLTALAEFAGGAGHEINNPLAVISGQAQYILKQMVWAEELLLEDPTPTALLEAIKTKLTKPLQIIVSQSQRIHHVITDLMQFARPPASRIAVVPVSKLIAEATFAVRLLAEERRVRLVCPEVSSQLAVRVDPGQIRLALTNLLRNGLEAAPQEGWTSLRVQREANGGITFAVEDNGPGIAEAHREHLFDPFYSGRAAGRGRGLGLSTAWRLARQHGGDLVLERSTPGATRFHLLLPATDVIDNYVPATNGKREPLGYQYSASG